VPVSSGAVVVMPVLLVAVDVDVDVATRSIPSPDVDFLMVWTCPHHV